MSITTGSRDLVTVLEHKGQAHAKKVRNGLLKTAEGLIIPPSSIAGGDTKTGGVVSLSAEERDMFMMDEQPQSAQQPLQQDTQGQQPKRSRKKGQPSVPEPPVHRDVIVDIGIGNMGTIRSQCHHCYKGTNGVVIMGMGPLSYKPNAAVWDGDDMKNTMTLSVAPGQYFFAGEEFTDEAGIVNIILHKVPEPEE